MSDKLYYEWTYMVRESGGWAGNADLTLSGLNWADPRSLPKEMGHLSAKAKAGCVPEGRICGGIVVASDDQEAREKILALHPAALIISLDRRHNLVKLE